MKLYRMVPTVLGAVLATSTAGAAMLFSPPLYPVNSATAQEPALARPSRRDRSGSIAATRSRAGGGPCVRQVRWVWAASLWIELGCEPIRSTRARARVVPSPPIYSAVCAGRC